MYGIIKRLDISSQDQILQDCREVIKMSPLYANYMPQRGIARRDCTGNCGQCLLGNNLRALKPKSTNFGDWGWVALPCGYHYVEKHPQTHDSFPPIPQSMLEICAEIAQDHEFEYSPQSAYLSFYGPTDTLGRHQDISEKINRPVISISLGDSCIFEWGGKSRSDIYEDILLKSGDIFLFGEEHRYNYHSMKRVIAGTSPVRMKPGRINITIRQYNRL